MLLLNATAGHLSPYESVMKQELPLSSDNVAPTSTVTVNKKRRAPNAFFLFRSFLIANKLYPAEITHQSEVSRYVSIVWKSLTPVERHVFFKMADEEKLRFDTQGPREVKKIVKSKKARSSKKSTSPTQLRVDTTPSLPSTHTSLPTWTSSSDDELSTPNSSAPNFDFNFDFSKLVSLF